MVSLTWLKRWFGGREAAAVVQQAFCTDVNIGNVSTALSYALAVAPASVARGERTQGATSTIRKVDIVCDTVDVGTAAKFLKVNIRNHTQSENLLATAVTLDTTGIAAGVVTTLTPDQNSTLIAPGDVIYIVFSALNGATTLSRMFVKLYW